MERDGFDLEHIYQGQENLGSFEEFEPPHFILFRKGGNQGVFAGTFISASGGNDISSKHRHLWGLNFVTSSSSQYSYGKIIFKNSFIQKISKCYFLFKEIQLFSFSGKVDVLKTH
eukprot:TRINITY_DN34029_c0_g1_i1.p3 TRINITY_DN34029_c0_g1~~TRINITY_DN34029_c0_g1_i1.p3  ORF type:complete len:115 (-),score=7.57 TRINITY_DN34029_c0_g1_i1:538-882(-)